MGNGDGDVDGGGDDDDGGGDDGGDNGGDFFCGHYFAVLPSQAHRHCSEVQIEKTDQQSKEDYGDDADDYGDYDDDVDDGRIDGCEKKDNDDEEDDGVRGPFSLSFIM